MVLTFEKAEGTLVLHYDILVHGTTEQEHDQRLKAVLDICRENGIKLNPKKTKI